ncbi:MAG: (Fe-S)-binding protein [Deltaproteobacteria bacterium]|nr:(Fe-S)-binding protein [Deltaproteobacteria bacterium]
MEFTNTTKVFTCIQCGKCTGGCPESGRTPLNVRLIVRKNQFGAQVKNSHLWYCTSCGTCTVRCPRDVKPSEVIFDMRSTLVESGDISTSIQKALENTFLQKNPWGRARSKRAEWAEKSGVAIKHISDTLEKRLLLSCCVHAYDPRCHVIPVNISKLLTYSGIEFGILGEEECCCGNEIRRIGEKGLFEELREENISNFNRYDVREILTLSPHCMNTLKKEYNLPKLKVYHYTQLLWDMIREGVVKIGKDYKKRVAYHDPCFLGKQNGIFEEPRYILKSIEGLELLEFSRSRENSLCCEGGGGRMFYEVEVQYERNAKIRVEEAYELGVQTIVVSCPFCLMTLEEQAVEKGIEVKDISEILVEVLE